MTHRPKRWLVYPRISSLVIARFPHLHPLVVQILHNRGVRTPEDAQLFISPDALVADPYLLHGMTPSVDRLCRAIRYGEPIAVYGDFDVDGVTATALLYQALESLGAKVTPYIPHRIDEGYGLNREALKQLYDQGVRVVITVDCGVRSLDEVAYGKHIGLDMIITDHHAPGSEAPEAFAVINPKQALCNYPSKELSGAGLAFKLAQALIRREADALPQTNRRPITEDALVDLVALGTVADLVSLTGENRALVKQGLAQLKQSERPGLQAMMRQAALKSEAIDTGTIGYVLGPRLNAAGRLEHALMAFHLLTTQYPGEAEDLAQKLEQTNRERQRLTMEMAAKAREAISLRPESDKLLFVAAPEFPEGIVGLVASRLAEEFYRPAIAVHCGPEASRGSARSIAEFNIVAALDECRDLLVRHGGHSMAAGFTVRNENLSELEARLRAMAERDLSETELVATMNIDAEVPLSEMTWDLQKGLEQLTPYGYGNREPLFLSRNVLVRDAKVVGTEHLRMLLSDGQVVWDGIAFRQGSWMPHLPRRIDVVYQLEARTFNSESRLQLNVKDLLPSES